MASTFPRPSSNLSPLLSSSTRSAKAAFFPRRASFLRRHCWLACAAHTLVAGARRGEERGRGGRAEDAGDLKLWLDREGLPPCKVVLQERPSHDGKHRPIHYVAASEVLQAGDVAFSVPNSLVVTLERVLGDETVGARSGMNFKLELQRRRDANKRVSRDSSSFSYLTGSSNQIAGNQLSDRNKLKSNNLA